MESQLARATKQNLHRRKLGGGGGVVSTCRQPETVLPSCRRASVTRRRTLQCRHHLCHDSCLRVRRTVERDVGLTRDDPTATDPTRRVAPRDQQQCWDTTCGCNNRLPLLAS